MISNPSPEPIPAPSPPKGNEIKLRQPQNKAERRLIRDIQAGINARNAAMGQLARANRKIAQAEQGLRLANMITGESKGE